TAYNTYSDGRELELHGTQRPYREFIAWLQQQDVQAAETFWREKLAGFTAPVQLPVERSVREEEQRSKQNGELAVTLSEQATTALQDMARAHQLTLNTLFQGAWAILLSRYSREQDIVFGATVSGRPTDLAGAESMVGLFINTLPMRLHVQPEQSALRYLQELQAQQVEVRDYEYTPLAKVQGWSDVPRDLALFDTIVVFENYPLDETIAPEFGNLTVTDYEMQEMDSFPLAVMALPGKQLTIKIAYDRMRFDESVIARMIGHLQALLENLLARPERSLAELPMLTDAERHQLLVEWNQTAVEYPQEVLLHELFTQQAERTPDAIAVICGEEQLTYGELNRRANQLAHHLQKRGVGPDVLVGLAVERSLEMVIGLYGILKAGGAYLPIDPAYPSERIAYMLEDSQVNVLLTLQHLTDKIPAHEAHVICLDSDWSLLAEESEANCRSSVGPDNLSYMIYTSGSTGKPKGVLLPHRAVVNHNFAIARAYELQASDRILQFSSISFDIAVEEIFPTFLVGATLVLRDEHSHLVAAEFIEWIAKHRLTVLNLPTAYWHSFVHELSEQKAVLPETVRLMLVGGEKASSEAYATWKKQVGAHVRWINAYGPTEATVTATMYEPSEARFTEDLIQLPIGRPIDNLQLYVLDAHLQPVPIGVPGELHIGGIGLAHGYLGRPDLTAEKFIAHPFGDEGTRLYKTGDLVRYLPDGNVEYLGRTDDQVKIRGFRIELGEIETTLEGHPQVQEAVVIAREDVPGEKRLVAYLVTNLSDSTDASALRSYLKEKMPSYMVPSAFVQLDELPMTPNGKVDRRALPAPEQTLTETDVSYVAPRTELEQVLADIWSAALRRERIGVHDNFFELGGDSILSIQIISRAAARGIRLTPKDLFGHQTIAELATVAGTVSGEHIADQGEVTGRVELTPIQQWFFEEQFPEMHHWNMAMLFETREMLDTTILRDALAHLMQHHDALRMRFVPQDNGWQQENGAWDGEVPLTTIDLSQVSSAEQEAAFEKEAAHYQASLDLTAGLPIRVVAFNFGHDKPSRLLLIVHHLVIDGVSWRILLEDLEMAYGQRVSGQEIKLPLKTTSFQTWAAQLTDY
ncbi:MAG: non-ribosomal peptide synthetase, partial [Tumebacillaceae bacterium]